MGALDDFRRAIIANPEDDAPRLVFADWLDENDDPEQAAYIRASIALQRLPDHDPDQVALRVAAQRHWHKHHETWGPPLPKEVGITAWRRGFLDMVTLPSDKLALLGTILQQHPVRELQINIPPAERDRSWSQALEDQHTKQTLQTLQGIPEVRQLRRIQRLSQYSYGERIDLTSVAKVGLPLAPLLAGIAVLDAAHVSPGYLDAYGQHHITRLAGPARDADLQRLAEQSFPHLTDVDWSRGNLTAEGMRALLAAPWMAQLESLNLSSCGLRPDAIQILARGHFPKLHTLRLPWNWVNRSAARTLLQATGFPALRTLDLGDNDLYDADIAALAELPLLTQLHALDLRRNAIRREAATALAVSRAMPNLRYLNLADNLMGDDALRELLRYSSWPNLVHLDLRYNQTKTDGLYALVGSGLLPQLRILRVTIEQASPAPAWGHLFENGPALEELDLQDSELGDHCCVALLRGPIPPRLQALNLNQTQLGASALDTLAESPLATQLGELHIANHFPTKVWDRLAKSPLVESLALLDTARQGSAKLRKVFGQRMA